MKITRQNLYRPTALIHESGHQVAHIVGWNEELAALLRARARVGVERRCATAWASWSSEIAADTHAFVHTGYGSVAALHDVVSGGPTVFRLAPGDPHPIAYLRVLLGVQMCVRFFGAGPWDDLGRAWVRAYPLAAAPPDTRALAERSVPLLPRIAELCLLTPMRAFGGRPLVALVDPLRVRPDALAQLERDAGGALTTSSLLAPRRRRCGCSRCRATARRRSRSGRPRSRSNTRTGCSAWPRRWRPRRER